MNYRKKTEPVKAIQWTGENTAEVKAFLTEHCGVATAMSEDTFNANYAPAE